MIDGSEGPAGMEGLIFTVVSPVRSKDIRQPVSAFIEFNAGFVAEPAAVSHRINGYDGIASGYRRILVVFVQGIIDIVQ
jgi:hypothetical protein